MADYSTYLKDTTAAINSMYDAQRDSRLAELQNSYNQTRSDAEAARDRLPGQYQQQANDLAVQYERNRRNLNEQAAANGLNTGTASQAQLMANQGWMKGYGGLRTAQANAMAEADRGLLNLQQNYESQRNSAAADIEMARQQALISAQERQYARDLEQAQLRASYGDFSGFTTLGYDQQTIDSMRQVWIAQNPLLAYNTGAITADQYYKMTGQRAPGTAQSSGGGGYYYGGGSSSGKTDKSDAPDTLSLSEAEAAALNKLANTLGTAYSGTKDVVGKVVGAVTNPITSAAKSIGTTPAKPAVDGVSSAAPVVKPSAPNSTSAYPNIDLVRLMGGRS